MLASLLGLSGLGMLGDIGTGLLGYGLQQASDSRSYRRQVALMREQQSWMERLINTAHQREVKDLRAAGLNPILSATGGSGASVGGMPNASTSLGSFVRLPDLQLRSMTSQIAETAASAKKLKAEADLFDAKADIERKKADVVGDIDSNFRGGVRGLFDLLGDSDTYKGIGAGISDILQKNFSPSAYEAQRKTSGLSAAEKEYIKKIGAYYENSGRNVGSGDGLSDGGSYEGDIPADWTPVDHEMKFAPGSDSGIARTIYRDKSGKRHNGAWHRAIKVRKK